MKPETFNNLLLGFYAGGMIVRFLLIYFWRDGGHLNKPAQRKLWLAGFEAVVWPLSLVCSYFACKYGGTMLEVSPDGKTALVPTDGDNDETPENDRLAQWRRDCGLPPEGAIIKEFAPDYTSTVCEKFKPACLAVDAADPRCEKCIYNKAEK